MEDNPIKLTSKKKWFWTALIIAILNPIFSGLVLGAAFLSEPDFKKEGKIILTVAIAWGLLWLFFITPWLFQKGYFTKLNV